MNKMFVYLIKFYQLFISKLFPSYCRYYPTCSEYAIWQFQNTNLIKSIILIAFRILRCNPLFAGGIDYPVTKKDFPALIFMHSCFIKPKFWFVPHSKNSYYIVKSII